MEKQGFNKIILTPHYIKGTEHISNNLKKEYKLNQLKEKIRENKINIELYLGNEVYASDNILELLEKKEIITIVDKHEYRKLMDYVKKVDPKAFVTVYSVNEIRYQPKV